MLPRRRYYPRLTRRATSFPYAIYATQRRRQSTALISRLNRLKNTSLPGILLQAVIIPGDKTKEGQLIEAVSLPWFEIIRLLQRHPNIIYQLDWRKWEEIIAGAYKQQGFEVTLTPRSNDKGRDIIASSQGIGRIRYFDQMKAYKPGHLVTAEEVRAMVGVLNIEGNVSKGIITTTSDFAPGVLKDPDIGRLMPFRLELKAKDQLLDWLISLASDGPHT